MNPPIFYGSCNNPKNRLAKICLMCLECLLLECVHRIDAPSKRPLNPCDIQAKKHGELVDLGNFGSRHVGLLNMIIYSDKSLAELKRGTLMF